jgi:hypothetical protein
MAVMSPRIGIVGAGPGGLSLARLLTDRGFADVTVLERAGRLGGKSLTVIHEGLGHELGTCYVALGYLVVKRWMAEAGIGEFVLKNQHILTSSGDLVDFKDFVEGAAGIVGTVTQTARYVDDWLAFHKWDVGGARDDAEGTRGRAMREEVAEPFGSWLEARGLDAVRRFSVRSVSVMGYGSLDRVPALYGLRWNMPSLLATGAMTKMAEPVPGWLALWESIASKLDVRLGHLITSVERTGAGFLVRTDQGDLGFDHLVLTGPLDEAALWFPFTEDERLAYAVGSDLLGWHEFCSSLVQVRGWYRDADTWCSEARVKDAAAIAQGRMVGARRTGDKTPVASARSRTRPDLYVVYQYGDPARSDDEQVATLRADLAAEGATLDAVLRHCRWKYSPQLTPGAIRGGAVSRLERQQGKGNLWISGATASHEAVDNIVNYNARLVERMAVAFEGRDPSSDDTFASVADKFRFSLDDK